MWSNYYFVFFIHVFQSWPGDGSWENETPRAEPGESDHQAEQNSTGANQDWAETQQHWNFADPD